MTLDSPVDLRESIIKDLLVHDIVKFGDFTLKSGQKSNIYFDFRLLISYPQTLSKIARLLPMCFPELDGTSIDLLAGVPLGALPLASFLSQHTELPQILYRDTVKSHGTQRRIEGNYQKGQKVGVIEDVVTTGNSVLETCRQLELEGLEVSFILCLLDRREDRKTGPDTVRSIGYQSELGDRKLLALFTKADFRT